MGYVLVWQCIVGGFVFKGEEPPEECPQCGGPASCFVKIRD